MLQQQQQGGEKGRVSNHIVEQIQAYIAQHYAEKLTLTGIASQFYISPYYLSRLFKKSTNLSLIEYINGVRIKAAQHLIEQTAESISSVAGKTGFMTTAHFRRVFKDATGLSSAAVPSAVQTASTITNTPGCLPSGGVRLHFLFSVALQEARYSRYQHCGHRLWYSTLSTVSMATCAPSNTNSPLTLRPLQMAFPPAGADRFEFLNGVGQFQKNGGPGKPRIMKSARSP